MRRRTWIFALCAARWAWLRGGVARVGIAAWLALYVVGFAAVIVTSFD